MVCIKYFFEMETEIDIEPLLKRLTDSSYGEGNLLELREYIDELLMDYYDYHRTKNGGIVKE